MFEKNSENIKYDFNKCSPSTFVPFIRCATLVNISAFLYHSSVNVIPFIACIFEGLVTAFSVRLFHISFAKEVGAGNNEKGV